MNGDSLPSSIPKPGHGAGAPGPDTCIIHSRPAVEEAQIFGTGDTAGGRGDPVQVHLMTGTSLVVSSPFACLLQFSLL